MFFYQQQQKKEIFVFHIIIYHIRNGKSISYFDWDIWAMTRYCVGFDSFVSFYLSYQVFLSSLLHFKVEQRKENEKKKEKKFF